MRAWWIMVVAPIAHGAACAQDSRQPSDAGRVDALLAELPHVRVDREERVVEFDGYVPIDAHIASAPNLYLEVMVCTPDVRAHEALVASLASPASVHAALLLVGLTPGHVGSWNWSDGHADRITPEGSPVEVSFVWIDEAGATHENLASDWIVSGVNGARFSETIPSGEPRWVFAGSRMIARNGREWYAAEAEGTIVGLHTFGSETIAWNSVLSPSADAEDPEWIADPDRVPRQGTRVVVRIRALQDLPDMTEHGPADVSPVE